jgi:PAS domain S-box-containing protein
VKRYFSNLATVGILTTVYFYAGKLGLAMAFVHPSATSVWPPAGIALAAVLFLGYWVWPAILLGAFLVNITTEGSVATSLGIAVGNTLEAILGAFLVRRFANGCNAFDRAEDFFKFTVLAGVISTALSATVGVTSLALGGFARWDHYFAILVTWWSGDMVSVLIIAPLLLVWGAKPFRRWTLGSLFEAASLLSLVFLVGQFVFGGWISNPNLKYYLQEFLCVPPLLWAAFRFGQHGAVTASFIMSALAIWGTLNGFGPFATRDVFAITDPYDTLVLLQQFMGSLALTGLIVASVLSQRGRVEEKFQLAVESAPNAMIMANHEGRILLVNKQTERLFGYTRGELLGQSIDALVPQRYRQRHGEYRGAFLSQPTVRPMGAGRDLYGLKKDGGEVPVEIGLNPVPTEEGLSVLASVVDITERKRAEKEVQESEEKFRAIAETMPDILFTHRPDGWCDYANQRFYAYTGMAPGSANGFGWITALHPEEVERTESKWMASVRTGAPIELRCRLRSSNERYRWFIGRTQPVRDAQGKILKWFCAWTDIDGLMRAEGVLRATALRYRKVAKEREEQLIVSDRLVSVGELAATLAHEFNNPLQIITGFTQDLLTETNTSDNHYQSLKIIEEAAGRCKKTINNLLDLARPDPARKEATDFAEIVRKSIELISSQLKQGGVEIEVEIPLVIPQIYADPQQLEQVLLNLFFNAREAMSSGGTLTIRAEVRPRDGATISDQEIMIAVSDTGTGIDAEDLPHIFRPFFTTKKGGGMGLGLSVCESIVKNHGGSIVTESTPGQGTTFFVYLPALRQAEALSTV